VGKTTAARYLRSLLIAQGYTCIHLDGDELRLVLDASDNWTEIDRRMLGARYASLAQYIALQVDYVVVSAVAVFKETFDQLSTDLAQAYVYWLGGSWENLVGRDDRGVLRDKDEASVQGLDRELPADVRRIQTDGLKPAEVVQAIAQDVEDQQTARNNRKDEAVVSLLEWTRGANSRGRHWDSVYRINHVQDTPSPFSEHVAQTLSLTGTHQRILDFGCGDGRDADALASQGLYIGWDTSQSAIDACRHRTYEHSNRITFVHPNDESWERVLFDFKPNVLYSRFVLHSMNEGEEDAFFQSISGSKAPLRLFLECRSNRDISNRPGVRLSESEIVHGHYRRFIDKELLLGNLTKFGFSILSVQEEAGLAPNAEEDPIIIRVSAEKRDR